MSPPNSGAAGRRRTWPAINSLTAGATIVALALIGTCTLSSLRWLERPFPGFFLWPNRFVPALGDTDWTGYEAQLPFPAQVIEVDGQRVTSAAEVYEHAARRPLGTAVSYTFEVARRGSEMRAVRTMRLSLPEYLWTLGAYLAIGTLLTALGIIVYALRPDAPAAFAMLCAGGCWGLYLVTAADIIGPAWFRPLCLLLQAFTPVTLVHLAFTFPSERAGLRRRPWLLPCLYAAAAVLGMVDNLVFDDLNWMLALNSVHAMALVPSGLLLLGMLAFSFLRPESAAARQRIKVAALGAAGAFLLPLAGIALFALAGVTFPLNFLALPLALFPAAIGYAIVKHDLFEVDAIIRRTVAWAILTVLIALLYLGGVGGLDLLLTGRRGRIGQLLILLVVVALFSWLRERVQGAVDFLFARDRYDYGRTVGAASRALATLLDTDTIVDRILQTITGAMHVDFGAVWLRDTGGYRLHAVAGSRAAPPQALDSNSPLVATLERDPQHVVADDAAPPVVSELRRCGGTLVIPMTFENRLSGFLALGDKLSGALYSHEDIRLLQTLADQGAVAVQNARSYQALELANEELRSTQSRLVEAERLAAIGELSAAVAHGIRNPLAGIKAAAQLARMDLAVDHPMQESIHDILSETQKLEKRIQTLLDFAKPFEPHPDWCELKPLIESAVASLRSQLNDNHVEVGIDVDPPGLAACIDAAQIEEVLLALMSNAIEAMSSGGRIQVSAHPMSGDSAIRLEVADNGPGIAPDQLPRVFRLFFTTKSSGTGFGLAVAKKVVERHAGNIEVVSAPGQGARFIIDLPLQPAAATTTPSHA